MSGNTATTLLTTLPPCLLPARCGTAPSLQLPLPPACATCYEPSSLVLPARQVPEVLQAVSPERVLELQQGLAKVWRRCTGRGAARQLALYVCRPGLSERVRVGLLRAQSGCCSSSSWRHQFGAGAMGPPTDRCAMASSQALHTRASSMCLLHCAIQAAACLCVRAPTSSHLTPRACSLLARMPRCLLSCRSPLSPRRRLNRHNPYPRPVALPCLASQHLQVYLHRPEGIPHRACWVPRAAPRRARRGGQQQPGGRRAAHAGVAASGRCAAGGRRCCCHPLCFCLA